MLLFSALSTFSDVTWQQTVMLCCMQFWLKYCHSAWDMQATPFHLLRTWSSLHYSMVRKSVLT
jgi:hypothetical protein